MAKRKKGPTPPRRVHRDDAILVARLQALDALVGQRNVELADARARIASLERTIADLHTFGEEAFRRFPEHAMIVAEAAELRAA